MGKIEGAPDKQPAKLAVLQYCSIAVLQLMRLQIDEEGNRETKGGNQYGGTSHTWVTHRDEKKGKEKREEEGATKVN